MLQNGFSIAVASFLLLRTDKRMEELKDAVLKLANVIETKGVKT
ncbi:YvrJ family protein [Synergistaceae bacterium OttesenSCG-928-D05]|nr:YvrJ family protein [Synergistaceae bacterium OttesenSCG-928-D05]